MNENWFKYAVVFAVGLVVGNFEQASIAVWLVFVPLLWVWIGGKMIHAGAKTLDGGG